MTGLAAWPTALHDATREAHLAALLAGGAAADQPDSRSFTPLIMASYHGQADTVAPLLRAGVAVDAKGSTALSRAAFKGHCGIAQQLLAAAPPWTRRMRQGERRYSMP